MVCYQEVLYSMVGCPPCYITQGPHTLEISKFPAISQLFRSWTPAISQLFRSWTPTISQLFRSSTPAISQLFRSSTPTISQSKLHGGHAFSEANFPTFLFFQNIQIISLVIFQTKTFSCGFPTTLHKFNKFLIFFNYLPNSQPACELWDQH